VDFCRTAGGGLPGALQQVVHASGETGQGSWLGRAFDFSAGFVKALGAAKLLGAVGLLDIAPVLVTLAAFGLRLIMTAAAIVELRRQEFKHVLLNLTYLAKAAFVAWGRFGPGSFTR
jgi:hypothetical protein